MFTVVNSSKEKSILKVLLKKQNPTVENKFYLVYRLVYNSDSNGWVKTAFHKKRRGLQLIKISSKRDRPQLSAGLFFSDQSYRTLEKSLIRKLLFGCLLAEPTSFSKKNKKKMKKIMRSKWSLIRPNCVWRHLCSDPIALEVASDQTKVRSNPPIIRPNCARNCLWSDPSAFESAYDQTFQTKTTSDQTISRPWSDRSALELPKRPCNFGLGTHGCALDWVLSEVILGLDLNLGRCGVKILIWNIVITTLSFHF